MNIINFLLICVLLASVVSSLKNPCHKRSGLEFWPHPKSIHHYIQCSKRGDMYIRECNDEQVWNNVNLKCDDQIDREQSQIKTLKANYKISQLMAAKKEVPVEEKVGIDERNRIEKEKCSKVFCPSGFRCALDKDDLTLICDPIIQTTTTTSTTTTTTTTTQAPKSTKSQIEDLQIESQNIIHEKMGHTQIQARKKDMMLIETDQLKDQMNKQAKINKNVLSRTDRQKEFEQRQMDRQRMLLETLNRKNKIIIDQTVDLQKIREGDLLDQQVELMESMVNVNKGVQADVVNRQRIREKADMEEMVRKQKEIVLNEVKRQRKERDMCEKVFCPSGFRCALDKDGLTLMCADLI